MIKLLSRSLTPVSYPIPDMMAPATGLTAGVAVDVVEEPHQSHQRWSGIGAVLFLVVAYILRLINDVSFFIFF